jgi:malonyl-CoA/methylmalonyl-CoA synthetase
VLDDQPGVLESAVIGLPHPDLGEVVLGVLVARRGEVPDLEAIMTQVRAVLARFKHPRRLVVMDALPRNTMGKVQKNLLRARIAAQEAAL